MARCKGKAPPLTMQAFTKLVDGVGAPPAPAPDPPAQLPPPLLPGGGAPAAGEPTHVPTWQEAGFNEAPTTIFKVRRLLLEAAVVFLEGARDCTPRTCAPRG